jgi:hypothetical protein
VPADVTRDVTQEAAAEAVSGAAPRPAGTRRRRAGGSPLLAFAVQLALVLLVLLATKPDKAGDFFEYGVTTIALARHGTPDVRAEDAALAAALSPEAGYRTLFLTMREHLARGEQVPMPGLYGGRDGIFTIHFFAYPALAALPFRLLMEAGAANPFKAFQFVNFGALWLLGLVMFSYFGSGRRAFAALGLVLLSGGILYANWCSPEMLTAAALLAGMMLFASGRPLAGGLLAGVAAMQNPSLAFFSLFAPLFAALDARGGPHPARWPGWGAVLAGAGLQGVLALMPFAFGQWQWGRPSIIALYSTDRRLVGLERLFSYYLDLNQGMILVIPGILVLLACAFPRRRRRLALAAGLLTALFMLALALPTLSALNWNAGSKGVQRYAFWGAMPLLFLAFSWLRARAHWPRLLLGAVFALQLGAMAHARSYDYREFSPLARYVLDHAPAGYNPDPEIFIERSRNADGATDVRDVAAYPRQGQPRKVLFNAANGSADRLLCPAGQRLSTDLPAVELARGWRYLNGAQMCVPR